MPHATVRHDRRAVACAAIHRRRTQATRDASPDTTPMPPERMSTSPSSPCPSSVDTPADALRASVAAALTARPGVGADACAETLARWDAHAATLLAAFVALYGDDPCAGSARQRLLSRMIASIEARSAELRALDASRERDPTWFLAADMIGYTAYVDRFAGTLRGVGRRVEHLQRLGVRYLHLLPFLRARAGDNDGGFAVSDYDAVQPALGDIADLDALTARLRRAGISLCADLVLNHTADDHAWARAARAGDPHHRAYYHIFPDRTLPDHHERDLGQVFPVTAPGNFTDVPGVGCVWTTFYPYQWDLDWSNPDVFVEMASALMRLANRGVEIFRLDATPYLWKRPGTSCMNQPEVHTILRAIRALCAIVAPATLLKAEAIVPARELLPYFGDADATGAECHLAYHSTLMAGLWAGLAEQRGDIVGRILHASPAPPHGAGWLTYLRCHDDIGWYVLAEESAGSPEHAPFDLARISRFYAGETTDSYARGRRFQSVGDGIHGTNGMTSALVGIADALARGDAQALDLAERRMRMLHGVILALPGLPTLYMGDEIALGNDENASAEDRHAGEGRWLHRPSMDWATADTVAADDGDDGDCARTTTAARIHAGLRRMIAVRIRTASLRADAPAEVLSFDDPAILGVRRGDDVVLLCNFSARPVTLDTLPGPDGARWRDLLADGEDLSSRRQSSLAQPPFTLAPYAVHWLERT